jgi:hypothetical protein
MQGLWPGLSPSRVQPLGWDAGPGAKALLFDIERRISSDPHRVAPPTRKYAEVQEGLSLALARGLARQLALRCKVPTPLP